MSVFGPVIPEQRQTPETFCDDYTPFNILSSVQIAAQRLRYAYDSQDEGIISRAEQRLFDCEVLALAERFARENQFVN